VLENGHVVEEGTHDSLLASHGRYATLWNRQMQEEEAA
jgi:ATP-binding cassette subfamily B protein